MSQQPSGIDLARAALAAARADAKNRPAQPQHKTRTTTSRRTRTVGDPVGLGAAITAMMTERDWRPPEAGGSILDQWATIAPELVGKVAAVRFEHDTGILHLRPVSPAYATQLRMFRPQILRRIHDKTGDQSVRDLRILPPGAAAESAADSVGEETAAPAVEEPVKTRETAHPGYQATLEAVFAHRPDRQPTDPYVVEALARQENALRAHRQPETEHRDAVWEVDRLTADQADPAEQIRRAAIARARQQKADGDVPRRLFGAA